MNNAMPKYRERDLFLKKPIASYNLNGIYTFNTLKVNFGFLRERHRKVFMPRLSYQARAVAEFCNLSL